MSTGAELELLDSADPAGRDKPATRVRDPWDDAEGGRLLCRFCGSEVTARGWACPVQGCHEHSFVNPHGYLYRIACFRLAPGCVPWGPEIAEYSWFPGATWQIAHCAGCGSHLGWSFRTQEERFHGLIMDRLVEQARGEV
mgnify:CR=1 FL=1